MTLLPNGRRYLDWNASSLLCENSRISILKNLDGIGNASSIHFEGREAKNIIEQSRDNIMELLQIDVGHLIFTSGASEAAALLLHNQEIKCSNIEHECIKKWCDVSVPVENNGLVSIADSMEKHALQLANSETGIMQKIPMNLYCIDAVQGVGKISCDLMNMNPQGFFLASHKLCGPKGVGLLYIRNEESIEPIVIGGGQEFGLRAGTENYMLIAAFSEALAFSLKLVSDGVWEKVQLLRDMLENGIKEISEKSIVVGADQKRLPNTSCIITPGWKGESQVIALDLEGFSVSSGTACSSGKINTNDMLLEMGYDQTIADCSIRVSLGPYTKKSDIESFIFSWKKLYSKHQQNWEKSNG